MRTEKGLPDPPYPGRDEKRIAAGAKPIVDSSPSAAVEKGATTPSQVSVHARLNASGLMGTWRQEAAVVDAFR
jgi:hypothetical protein